jgi:hypothetical protein
VLFQHLSGVTEGNQKKNLRQDRRHPGRGLNPRTLEYEAVLNTRPRRSILHNEKSFFSVSYVWPPECECENQNNITHRFKKDTGKRALKLKAELISSVFVYFIPFLRVFYPFRKCISFPPFSNICPVLFNSQQLNIPALLCLFKHLRQQYLKWAYL